jgi:DUF1680 family protein
MQFNKKSIVSILLTLMLVVTLFPSTGVTSFAAPTDLYRAATYSAEEGNIARLAFVRQLTNTSETRYNPNTGAGVDRTGINASFCNDSYGIPSVQVLRLTDGLRPEGGTSTGYLSWSYTDTFGMNGRLYFIINWGQPFTIDAIRCDWWTDGNVSVPNSEARVEWLDGTVWREVTNMRDPATGAAVANIGTRDRGNWNAVTFDPVVTSQLRLRLHRTGTLSNGIGVGEWEVFGVSGDPELLSVSASGETSPVVSTTNTYTSSVVFPNLPGVTYEWSTSGSAIAIVGSNTGSTVQVEAANVGTGRLTVTARHNSGVQSAIGSLNINVQNISATIVGDGTIPITKQNTFTSTVSAGTLTGLTYQWSLNNQNAVIVGSSTGSAVTVEGVTAGEVTLTLKINHTGRQLEATTTSNLTVKQMRALDYVGATSAGTAPILPRRVIVEGLRFDLPTASAASTAKPSFNFAEEFESSLVPVTWDMNSFTAADYAANRIGQTFTVTGVTSVGSRAPGFSVKATFTVNTPRPPVDYNHSVTSENVIFENGFWAQRQLVNATVTLDAAATQLAGSASYAERNFVNALGRLQQVWGGNTNPARGTYSGYVFQDTDVYKTLEGYAYNLAAIWDDASVPAARKTELLDKAKYWISLIEAIQYADGYVNSCFSNRSTTSSGGSGTGDWRWRYMQRHEMYNIGHFLEAAVAYTRFAVSTNQADAYVLYEVGKRTSDHIVEFFGPGGKRVEVPGHEEIELALMKFAELCEEYEGVGAGQKYRDTVELLVDRRGRKTAPNEIRESAYYSNSAYNILPTNTGATYSQDYTPLVMETRAVGHAVRAMYFYTGATDIAIALPNSNPNKAAFLNGISAIYETASERNTYITGGLGSGESSEGFGPDWRIRGSSAYTENCAAIAGANWYQRLNLFYEDAKYADSYERALFNGVLVGVNLYGNRFFYGCGIDGTGQTRGTWQGCACCPPNVIRTIANMGGYVYTVNKDAVFVNMYGESKGNVNVQGDNVKIDQVTDYPWDGAVKLTVKPPVNKTFTLNLRVPGWVKAQKYQQCTLVIDGTEVDATPNAKGYISITRAWPAAGTTIDYVIPMEIRFTEGDDNVSRAYNDFGVGVSSSGQSNKVVIERGPLVYHLEQPGVPNGDPATATTGRDARSVYIPRDMDYTLRWSDMLNGVYVIEGNARFSTATGARNQFIQLTPYYTKENRGNNPQNTGNAATVAQVVTGTSSFKVWINSTEMDVQIRGDKNMLNVNGTAKLTANPKVNYDVRTQPSAFEWTVISGKDVIEMSGAPVDGRTDDSGPGKIGGLSYTSGTTTTVYTRPTSTATYKALKYGRAIVKVDMKNATGTVLATDTYEILVSADLSANNAVSVTGQLRYGSSTSILNNEFKLVPTADMNINMVIAKYNAKGAMVDSELRPLALKAGVTTWETLATDSDLAGDSYSVFFWDGNYRPVSASAGIN